MTVPGWCECNVWWPIRNRLWLQ